MGVVQAVIEFSELTNAAFEKLKLNIAAGAADDKRVAPSGMYLEI